MKKQLFISIAALGLAACSSTGEEETVLVETETLHIVQTSVSVEGTFIASTGTISFAADEVGENRYQVRVYVGDIVLGIDKVADNTHVVQPSGLPVAVDESLKASLTELVTAFSDTLARHRDEALPDQLFRVVNMLSSYPLGGEITHREIVADADGRDWVSLCGSLGMYNTAYHDFGGLCWWCDSHGTMGQTFWMGGGYDPFGDGCLGVCGGGCAGTDYTQDCLDHDACEGHHGNSGAASIPGGGCSDEYASSTDDWLSAPNCGWHGYGPCGDYICEGYENVYSCPTDCSVCGDGICSGSENSSWCPSDCGQVAGSGMCAGYCGTYSAYGCWCDSLCSSYGDCCADGTAQTVCGYY